jgi:hypothetical protein
LKGHEFIRADMPTPLKVVILSAANHLLLEVSIFMLFGGAMSHP